jgi:hypothetical protein
MALNLDEKLGPLSRKAWIGVGLATGIVYYLYKRHESASSASSADALEGGDTVPTDTSGSTSSTANSFSTIGAWEAAAIAAMTGPGYSSAQALNDLTSWLAGQCVSAAGYNAISSIIGNASVGLPPGYNSLPAITVCPSSSTPAPTSTTTSTSTTSGGSNFWAGVVGSTDSALAKLDPNSFQHQYNFGSYTFSPGGPGTQFTQVGTIVNGHYQGANILNGAPAYAEAFGALVQDFDPSKLPNGTAVYVPTYLVQQGYVEGVGTPT